VTMSLLRQTQSDPAGLAATEAPFSWKPVFVRRSLGLAVVEACATGRFRAPAAAIAPIASEAVAEWEHTGWRTYHWEPWLAGLAPGARATVLADALGWATSLWSAFDWSMFITMPQLGGADDQWVSPTSPAVRLKGRCELRLAVAAGDVSSPASGEGRGAAPLALVSVSAGCPGPGWREELAFLALVAALRSPARPLPARVVGVWPDSGSHGSVEISIAALEGAMDRVAAAVRARSEARLR